MQKTLAASEDIVGDQDLKRKIRRQSKEMPKMLWEPGRLVTEVHGHSTRLDKNLQNLEGFTGPLGDAARASSAAWTRACRSSTWSRINSSG